MLNLGLNDNIYLFKFIAPKYAHSVCRGMHIYRY